MKESVSAILICNDEFFIIKRRDNLKAFPGYYSFPGGKVDDSDAKKNENSNAKKFNLDQTHYEALVREVHEEVGIILDDLLESGDILDLCLLGCAVTPDFNPHRFKNFYFKIFLKKKIDFILEDGEIAKAKWYNAKRAFEQFLAGDMLVVPPMITILEDLSRDINSRKEIDPNLKYDSASEVPMITPVNGVNQYLPLSNTFPPANRTNCFFIGDDFKVLIDPSPKDRAEFEKLLNTLKVKAHRPDLIFLTHHHPDHHEYSVDMAKYFNIPMGMSEDTYKRLDGSTYFKDLEIKFYKEGDILTSSNSYAVNILHTPGHDEGQLTLMREDKAWAIVSDLIQTVGTVVIGGDEGDMKKYFHSLERMIALNPTVVIPSHGIAIGGVQRLVETLHHRKERELVIKKLLKENFNEDQMLSYIYPDLPVRLHKYARLTIQSHIKKIQKES